ncbi:prolyl 4-hydroxylase subunit alpha-3, partial [Aplysia californica]|uniref:Prolyl 4-hydroxylase subunit alpha-3 n=1 Tax=Aplysia californica TaxID=6500 RepID=A0ABM1AFE2_APLCA
MAGRTRDVRLCATMLLGAMFVGVALLLVPVGGNVVTSIHRIKDMLVREEDILNSLQDLIASRSREKEEFTQFYNKRIQQIRSRNVTKTLRRLSHPNSIFSLIQTFADDYRPLRKISARWPKNAEAVLDKMANDEDVNGARLSLIRLQEMYGIKPRDMIKGNYLGHKGPSLTALDSFFVGRAAFDTKKYPESVEWFQAVLNLLKKSRGNRKDPASDPSSMGQIGSPEE